MKACRKCRIHNESTAKFCFQCGTKLSTITSGFQVPTPSKRSVQSWISPVDPVDFITHPMQRSEDVITSKNQGKHIAPKLESKLGIERKATQPPVEESVKVNAAKPQMQPLQVKQVKAASPRPETAPRIRSHQPADLKKAVRVEPRKAEKPRPKAVETQAMNNQVGKRKPLLDSSDRLLLQKKMPSRAPSGVKPREEIFAMRDVVSIQERKEELERSKARKRKVQEDLAYLDKILPVASVEEAVPSKPPAEVKVETPKEQALTPSVETIVQPVAIAAKVEIPQVPRVSRPPEPVEMNHEISMDAPGEAVLDPSRSLQSHSWLQMVQGARQRTPSEQLKGYEHGDSSEFITPFLTLAAFLYFCYVLYV